jgi:hypothetical protein
MCTIAVAAMAAGAGKKIMKAGSRIVPRPNPQKKLKKAPPKAAITIIKIENMQRK